MAEKVFTIEEIKKAFWQCFHKSGEKWFNYLGTDEENESSTNGNWEMFLYELDEIHKDRKELI